LDLQISEISRDQMIRLWLYLCHVCCNNYVHLWSASMGWSDYSRDVRRHLPHRNCILARSSAVLGALVAFRSISEHYLRSYC